MIGQSRIELLDLVGLLGDDFLRRLLHLPILAMLEFRLRHLNAGLVMRTHHLGKIVVVAVVVVAIK